MCVIFVKTTYAVQRGCSVNYQQKFHLIGIFFIKKTVSGAYTGPTVNVDLRVL